MEIILVTISLDRVAGGLERNFVWLANSLSKNGNNVTLITFDYKKALSFYQINRDVEWIKLNISKPHEKISIINKILTLIRLRNVVKKRKNCVIICFHHGILARIFFSTFGLGIKIICSERNSLSLYKWVKKPKFNLNFLLLFWVDKIIVQFERYKLNYPKLLMSKIIVISNPVHNILNDNQSNEIGLINDDRFIILNVARLSRQKNQDLLILEFKKIEKKYSKWDLYIIGSGEMELSLKELISKLCLQERVKIIKPVSNIQSWYKRANIFCLPSRWEGFPNALAEALANKLPAIGLTECDGVNDLIENNVNGFLCSENQISIYLEKLIADEKLRSIMAKNAEQILKNYDSFQIEKKWLFVINNL
jgi:GalNAc-alpha-(1->4)-GalNAc-alpha-(1->3)-diNAcBac-PP-undecaprenol alpha-1,4-N-acetyl-D-galactosaminyltransferase